MTFLLVHSPVVGPSSLRPTAEALRAWGDEVLLPDLTGVEADPRPEYVVATALEASAGTATDGPMVVVGHSGAGAVLPWLAARSSRPVVLVFLDAVLPDASADAHVSPPSQRELLDQHTDPDGRLRPWLDWWTEDVVASLLPEEVDRAAMRADGPRLPRRYYDEPVPLPAPWPRSGYVALGESYLDELADARGRGWPTTALPFDHLATITAPSRVAIMLREMARALTGAVDEPR